MARPKKTSAVLADEGAARTAARELLRATIAREQKENERELLRVSITRQYEKPIADLLDREKDLTEQLKQYMLTHAPKDRKSLDLQYAVIGTRKSPAALKLLNKAWTWAAALAKLREEFGARFLRKKEPEIDKDLVKAEIPAEELGQYGLKLDQEEEFFIDLNRVKSEEPA